MEFDAAIDWKKRLPGSTKKIEVSKKIFDTSIQKSGNKCAFKE